MALTDAELQTIAKRVMKVPSPMLNPVEQKQENTVRLCTNLLLEISRQSHITHIFQQWTKSECDRHRGKKEEWHGRSLRKYIRLFGDTMVRTLIYGCLVEDPSRRESDEIIAVPTQLEERHFGYLEP